jgi:spore coat assembly protein SafA
MAVGVGSSTSQRTSPTSRPDLSSGGGQQQHTVQRGDTLSHIAKDRGVDMQDLIQANPQIANPDRIYPGQVVNIPEARAATEQVADASGVPRRPTTLSSGRGVQQPNGGLDPSTMAARLETQGALRRGANGPEVGTLQGRLRELGFDPGPQDGIFGRRTHAALQDFQRSQSLPPTGTVGPQTQAALDNPRPVERAQPTPGSAPRLEVYEPGSPEARALFRDAARLAGVPESWADSAGLHNILRRESGGKVGVPNYTYGARARDPSQWGSVHDELRSGRITARSSATGLGQLLLSNVDRYYPAGRAGIGDPVQEAAGMLRYIQDRYGTPDNAWRLYGTRHEGY